MKNTDIVMINMSSYSEWAKGVSNRNHQVFRELEKNPDVRKIMLIDYPPLTWKRLMRNYKENIIESLEIGQTIKRSPWGKVIKLNDRVYIYSFVDFVWQPQKFFRRLQSVLTELEFDNFISWSFFPPAIDYLDNLKSRITIFDAVDNWAEHSSYIKLKKRLQKNYQTIKQKADIIFTVAEDLQKLFDNQPNVYWIPNGVEIKHYQSTGRLVNRDISDLPHPIVGYIGVIQDRVDLQLIKYLAKHNPDKSFVLVGPTWYEAEIKELEQTANIKLLGYKEYEQAPSYIQQFDVGIIPHKKSNFVTSTNPMKMYEYLACGKPVVATAQSGAEMFKHDVYLANGYEDFNNKIQKALTENDEQQIKRRKQLMEDHSWTKAVKEMINLIDKKLNY